MRDRNVMHRAAPAALHEHHDLCRLATGVARDEEFIAFALADAGEPCAEAFAPGGAADLPALGAYLRESSDITGPRWY